MYLRWAERHRFRTEIVDQQEGEQTGLKSVTVAVDGRRAYGWLRAERGVHRLVRISPYDAQKRRQTTFALVEVLPEVDDDVEIELDWDEIRVDTFRSQGAGGQHVNKTDSAVRLTHLPTGIVAQSQNERSQTQNKETAIKVLKARLLERALEEKEAELRKLRGEHVEAGWGNQIRSYVLHPYQMVKDLRTGVRDLEHGGRARRRPRRLHAGRAGARGDRRPPSPPTTPSDRGRAGQPGRPAVPRPRPTCRPARPTWRAGLNDYLVPIGQSPRSPPTTRPCAASTPTPWPPIPERFLVGDAAGPAADERGRRRSPRRSGAARSGSCRCCSSSPASRRAGSAARSSIGVLPAGGDGRHPGHVHRRAPSRSRTACTPRSGSCPGCRCSTSSGRPARPEALAALPDGIRAVPFAASAPAERDRRRRRRARRRSTGPIARLRPPPGSRVRPPPGPGRLRLPRRPGRPARLRLRLGGRADRADRRRGPGPPRPDRRPTSSRPSCPAGASAIWVPGAAGEACRRSSGPASGSRASRSSSAGPARSPTSPATCRSRPGSCELPAGRCRRPASAGPRLACRGGGCSLGETMAPSAVPAVGVQHQLRVGDPGPLEPRSQP